MPIDRNIDMPMARVGMCGLREPDMADSLYVPTDFDQQQARSNDPSAYASPTDRFVPLPVLITDLESTHEDAAKCRAAADHCGHRLDVLKEGGGHASSMPRRVLRDNTRVQRLCA